MSTAPLPRKPRRLHCLPQDASAIVRRLPDTPIERELPGCPDHRYLDDLIGKPWGREYRVYDDAFVDVWLLALTAGASTSLHCHPRKDTVLLCLHGHGVLTTGDGRRAPIAQGTVLQIDQGAMHRSTALSDLMLVEIETPRDKLDLLRFSDEAGRDGSGYEKADHVERRLHPLRAVSGGPPRARVRPQCETGMHGFALEQGADIGGEPSLMFAISLDPGSILRRELTVSGPHTGFVPSLADTHLTIRINNQEDSP